MRLDLVRFATPRGFAWGVVQGDEVSAPELWHNLPTGGLMARSLQELKQEWASTPVRSHRLAQLELLAPITANQQLLFQLGNYYSHLREVGMPAHPRPRNVIFSKAASSLAPGHGAITRPADVRLLDFEVELGLVIGRPVRGPQRLDAAGLPGVVRALVLVNDISARDSQVADGQYFLSKSHRGFCRVGPWLHVLEDRPWERLWPLQLRLWVNGTLRQDATTQDMVHLPHETLSRLAEVIDLEPGDLLATGTPGGRAVRAPHRCIQQALGLLPSAWGHAAFVGDQARSGRYLKPGDRLRAQVFTDDGQSICGGQDLEVVG
jgi:2-keto-4-pentenoate hydratase/2-oxohepta-3-ene-1,7-dioic acid hydratase in catechol pathway